MAIGMSIVALGTSLPELSTTLVAAKKKKFGIVIGNIIFIWSIPLEFYNTIYIATDKVSGCTWR